MMSRRPASAPPGKPPATIFAIVHRSAVIPKACCAPPGLKRNPLMTSSKIRIDATARGDLAQRLQKTRRQRHLAP